MPISLKQLPAPGCSAPPAARATGESPHFDSASVSIPPPLASTPLALAAAPLLSLLALPAVAWLGQSSLIIAAAFERVLRKLLQSDWWEEKKEGRERGGRIKGRGEERKEVWGRPWGREGQRKEGGREGGREGLGEERIGELNKERRKRTGGRERMVI